MGFYSTTEFDKTIYSYEYHLENIPTDSKIKPPKWAKQLYEMKYPCVNAQEFYDSIFEYYLEEPISEKENYGVGNYAAIALEIVRDENYCWKANRYTITKYLDDLYELIGKTENFTMIAPVSYAGKSRKSENARFLYALCIEVDNIQCKKGHPNGVVELEYMWERDNHPIPKPTYIVCSGNGLHLYWVFEKPIPLFNNIKKQLSKAKQYLTKQLWNKAITFDYQPEKIQYESLLQAFRCVGSRSKGMAYAMAFQTGEKITLEYLNEFLPKAYKVNVIYQSELPLKKAKELYPDWYDRRIKKGEDKGHYIRQRGIYDNWKKKIHEGAIVGHRYFCLENLVSLATQCDIPFEEVENDAYELMHYLDTLTIDAKENPFTINDVECALQTYGTEKAYARNIDIISLNTGIHLQRTKRYPKGTYTRNEIMEKAKETRDRIYRNKEWINLDGAPTKKDIVEKWQRENPCGKKSQCIKETGLSKPTVYKWWKKIYTILDVLENNDLTDDIPF